MLDPGAAGQRHFLPVLPVPHQAVRRVPASGLRAARAVRVIRIRQTHRGHVPEGAEPRSHSALEAVKILSTDIHVAMEGQLAGCCFIY